MRGPHRKPAGSATHDDYIPREIVGGLNVSPENQLAGTTAFRRKLLLKRSRALGVLLGDFSERETSLEFSRGGGGSSPSRRENRKHISGFRLRCKLSGAQEKNTELLASAIGVRENADASCSDGENPPSAHRDRRALTGACRP